MNLHEYQSKQILKQYGVATSAGAVAFTASEAVAAAKQISDGNNNVWAVKSQIHAGGRGKGKFTHAPNGQINGSRGGVRIATSIDDVQQYADDMLGKILVTEQTGASGKKVEKIYIEAGCSIAHEFYISLLLDRQTSKIMVMASSEGGMDIEAVAAETPDKIITAHIDPTFGFSGNTARKIGFAIGLQKQHMAGFTQFLGGLYHMFTQEDCAMVEINPMVLTKDDTIIALDAKVSIDDNALYRHAETVAMQDKSEEDASELEAKEYELNYIRLDGEIGCMVNGAGLAMATMDIINIYGSSPANFLDVGGSATAERVQKAFEIILSDGNVKAILVNIFGGIMRCDVIAEGIINAAKAITIKVPLIVRLEGTQVETGRAMLDESGLNIISAGSLDEAARKAVASVKAG
ncbi:MAG: ADP-forming succinate--CoA ligase subunit beta [Alphaproteobacteria bacterium]|nr:ADP-forming succinate--CoA ligase subunit beta [Alphaproteobacteria bacterium]